VCVFCVGVEDIITDCRTSKVVVKGEKADPLKVLERVQRKNHRQVELISPIPKPKAEEEKKPEEAEKPKPEEKKEEVYFIFCFWFVIQLAYLGWFIFCCCLCSLRLSVWCSRFTCIVRLVHKKSRNAY
jgi:hypothetical protein